MPVHCKNKAFYAAVSNHLWLSLMQRKKVFTSIHTSIVTSTINTQHVQILAMRKVFSSAAALMRFTTGEAALPRLEWNDSMQDSFSECCSSDAIHHQRGCIA